MVNLECPVTITNTRMSSRLRKPFSTVLVITELEYLTGLTFKLHG